MGHISVTTQEAPLRLRSDAKDSYCFSPYRVQRPSPDIHVTARLTSLNSRSQSSISFIPFPRPLGVPRRCNVSRQPASYLSMTSQSEAARVLVVEDEPAIARLVEVTLAEQGYTVFTASTLARAKQLITQSPPDVIILDFGLPDGDGLELVREKHYGDTTRVLCLTASTDEELVVRALDAGADDYLAKPFQPDELCARIRSISRRTAPENPDDRVVVAGDVTVDLGRRLVKKRGKVIPLTRNEWKLIVELAKSPGRVISHSALLTQVWGAGFENDMAYLRVWVSRLRMKLEDNRDDPRIVITAQGTGYMLAFAGA